MLNCKCGFTATFVAVIEYHSGGVLAADPVCEAHKVEEAYSEYEDIRNKFNVSLKEGVYYLIRAGIDHIDIDMIKDLISLADQKCQLEIFKLLRGQLKALLEDLEGVMYPFYPEEAAEKKALLKKIYERRALLGELTQAEKTFYLRKGD